MKKKNPSRILLITAACLLAAGTAACKGKTEETKARTEEASEGREEKAAEAKKDGAEELDYDNMTAEDLVKDLIDKENLSDEEYLWLLSTYRYVPINDDLSIDYNNITTKAFSLLNDKGVGYGCSEESLKKLLASEYPQLRAEAYENMDSLFGISDEHKEMAKEALKTERDPFVLCAGIRALGNEGGSDPEAAAFLLDMAKHEDPRVRSEAAVWIGSSWNKNMEGAVEAEITMMNDPDEEVASNACRYCGGLGDDRVVEPLQAILNDDERYEDHGECIASLTELWLDYPFHENTSEAAYRACMEYYRRTPRSENVPFWTTISEPGNISEDRFSAWREKATYYDPAELISVMTELALDPAVNWIGRGGAFDVIKAHGGKEALEALKPQVDALTDENASLVQSSFEEKLKD